MHISSYQIHNVLSCYSRQLRAGRGGSAADRREGGDPLRSGAGGKRRATMEAVTNDIYRKLTRRRPGMETEAQAATGPQAAAPARGRPGADEGRSTEFVFNTVDRLNRKVTNQLPLEDAGGFIRRLEKLAQQATDAETTPAAPAGQLKISI